jgi:hypothetical protein
MVAMIASILADVFRKEFISDMALYMKPVGFKRILLKNIDRLTGSLATKVVCVSNSVKSISQKIT